MHTPITPLMPPEHLGFEEDNQSVLAKPQSVPTYDLFAPEVIANPYPLYKRIREENPVYYEASLGYWILTRYQDVEAALRDERLSSERRTLFIQQLGNLDVSLIQNFLQLTDNSMIEKDPPEHSRMRKLANQGFTTRALESWRSIIQKTTDTLLDQVQHQGYMDIVSDLSVPLPSLIIAKIFGVPESDRAHLIHWAKDISSFWGAPSGKNIEELVRKADTSAAQFTAFINQLVAERRQKPGTDMISLLTMAYTEQNLDFAELPSLCILILNAGRSTTTDLIPNGVSALLNHPQQLQKLKDNPALISSAIEEIIRYDSSVSFVFRIAKEDIEIGGQKIPAGSVIALGLAAANHDPAKFTLPDNFDIERSPNEHLAFGPGIHFCLGAVLARMELNICFSTLLKRFPNLQFDSTKPPLPRRNTFVFKGFDALPVRF
ncbi:cytochrome P450 [Cylindrospermum stagnale PCC 7417]|uniref:Cytochrome P450 n=1 Tax=Cylindrospermum stagnale PCC 7417 TaxID=56107 RepID=K9X7X1_9NOST|nr:cytochrome P450 [Cylindrospermum stagnale]AFZ27762.1 cytochrome P450 [Cylindrospermum stagnale PCC 7417]